MKFQTLRRALACALMAASLGGCAILQPTPTTQVIIADTGTGIDASYNAAAQAYLAVAASLTPAVKTQVKVLFAQAYAGVQAADAAAATGDAATLVAQIAAVTNLIIQIDALLPPPT